MPPRARPTLTRTAAESDGEPLLTKPTAWRQLATRAGTGRSVRGQGLVELALVLPLLLFMALAVFDFARVLTSAITVEAAAREAADYGGLYPWHWKDNDSEVTTAEKMVTRACTAASTLTDYEGDDPADGEPVTCINPSVSYEVIPSPDQPGTGCYDVPREAAPCRVEVTVVYDFHVIVPLRLRFGDTELGLPSTVTLTRTSTFAVSDFELDRVLEP